MLSTDSSRGEKSNSTEAGVFSVLQAIGTFSCHALLSIHFP